MSENYFKDLYDIDLRDKTKEKNNLSYIPWATSWAEVKKIHPSANHILYENSDGRPWFDDGKTGWVKVGVTINNITHICRLAIMDYRNQPIKASEITSSQALNSSMRALAKACAMHGVGLYIYEGEDLPEDIKAIQILRAEIIELMKRKYSLSDEAAEKVKKFCIEIDKNANGDPELIDDVDKLKELKTQLQSIRK